MGAAAGAIAAVESVTGVRPVTCPWRAYFERDVVEVLHAHRLDEKHQFYAAYGGDPPAWLATAVDLYGALLERVRSVVRRQRREAAERARAQQAPDGWESEGGGHA